MGVLVLLQGFVFSTIMPVWKSSQKVGIERLLLHLSGRQKELINL